MGLKTLPAFHMGLTTTWLQSDGERRDDEWQKGGDEPRPFSFHDVATASHAALSLVTIGHTGQPSCQGRKLKHDKQAKQLKQHKGYDAFVDMAQVHPRWAYAL